MTTASSPPEEGTAITIRCGAVVVPARLNMSATALAVAAALPVESEAGRFGDEIYFEIPVIARLAEDARQIVTSGEIAYWPPGRAFCIFWGPTPASVGPEIRAASRVNVIGHVLSDPAVLSTVRDGELIRVEKD